MCVPLGPTLNVSYDAGGPPQLSRGVVGWHMVCFAWLLQLVPSLRAWQLAIY